MFLRIDIQKVENGHFASIIFKSPDSEQEQHNFVFNEPKELARFLGETVKEYITESADGS